MFTNTVGKMMKIISTFSGMGEPNVSPFAYYYDNVSNSIYFTTRVTTKKVSNLRRRNIVSYCINDLDPPFKGVIGKGIIKIYEDGTYNIAIAKNIAAIEEVRVIRKVDPLTR
jgi:general stress protein 26